jgi:hypothetical protein
MERFLKPAFLYESTDSPPEAIGVVASAARWPWMTSARRNRRLREPEQAALKSGIFRRRGCGRF